MGMKIKKLEVEGFKSLKHVVWEPDDLNILIGPNGSGKTNLIKIFDFLAHSVEGRLGDFIKSEGGIEQIRWDKRADKISILLHAYTPEVDDKKTLELSYLLEFSEYYKRFDLTGEKLSILPESESDNNVQLQHQSEAGVGFFLRKDGIRTGHGGRSWGQETILSGILSSSDVNPPILDFANTLREFKIFYYPDTSVDSHVREPNITRYENILLPDGSNLITYIHTLTSENKDFEEVISSTMKAAFGSDFDRISFSPAADQYIQMRLSWKSLKSPQSAGMLSDGILKFLFLICVFNHPNPPSLIAIDEPELGLHPGLFPIIAEMAEAASEKSQVVIATHSPELLNCFTDKIPTTTVCEWQDGQTVIKNLEGEQLKHWLKDYKLGELFRDGDLEAM